MKTLFMTALLCASSYAAAISPEDYASGIPLAVDGHSALYEIPVPDAVYRYSVRPGLADVRVFNAAGEAVPLRIDRPGTPSADTEKRRLSLSLFPVQAAAGAGGDHNDLQIEFTDNGRIKTITSSAERDRDARIAYIIDTRNLDLTIDELVFDIEPGVDSFVQHVTIDTSDDLQNWRKLVTRGTLARLQHDGQLLERLSVRLLRQPADYLRVSLVGEQLISLKSVTAMVREPGTVSAEPIQGISQIQGYESGGDEWKARYFRGTVRQDSNVFHYDLEAAYPVERLNLRFSDTNTLALARFESRPDEDTDWRLRRQARVFTMSVDGMAFRNEDVAVRPQGDRYWRVTLQNAGHVREAPALFVRWQPHRLVFLARGDGPYVLAYGRAANAADKSGDIHQLLDANLPEDMTPGRARVTGQPYTLGGDERLQPQGVLINWRTISLWAVLILAVVLLGYMAVRLYRDINSRSAD